MGVLVLILLVLLVLLGSSERKRFEEYFEKNRLPNGKKISINRWFEIAMFSCFAAAIISGLITKDIATALGWAFVTLILVSSGGPYAEFAVAWWGDKPQKL